MASPAQKRATKFDARGAATHAHTIPFLRQWPNTAFGIGLGLGGNSILARTIAATVARAVDGDGDGGARHHHGLFDATGGGAGSAAAWGYVADVYWALCAAVLASFLAVYALKAVTCAVFHMPVPVGVGGR